jgi:lysophospholipase L1-like esterase
LHTNYVHFLALGDSYTIGEGVAAAERWPVQLADRLRAEGRPLADPHIIAQTGWTTDELIAGIETAVLQPPFALVSLLIGVNNQYRGRSRAEYQAQFAGLLQQAITFAGDDPHKVLVLSIPDWGVTPFAAGRDRQQIGADIDAFNAINRAETVRLGGHYIDITPLSRRAATDPSLLAGDGLHPSGKLYTAWVELVLPVALEII